MILESAERIKEYNEKGYWDNLTIEEVFQKNVAQYPDAIALIDPINRADFTTHEPSRFTFKQMDRMVNQLAAAFVESGLKKGDIIGIFMPNIHELIISFLAITKIGAIANPYPPALREYEISKMGGFTEIKAMVTVKQFKERSLIDIIRVIKPSIPSLQYIFSTGIENAPDEFSLDSIFSTDYNEEKLQTYLSQIQPSPNDIATICWTSGTTGMPKGVPRSHNLWTAIAHGSVEGASLGQDSIFLCPFPIVNMGGIGGAMIPWLLTGCRFVLHQPFELPVFLKQIMVEKVSYSLVPPALLNILLKNEAILANVDISSLKVLGSGSAPLTPWMIKGWKEKYNIDVTNFFGSNEGEVLLGAPNSIPDMEKRATLFPAFGAKGANFEKVRVAKGMQSKLISLTTGEPVLNNGESGELYIKGPTVFTGYYKSPESNKEVFDEDGYFKTGDVFELVAEDANLYYRFVERCKDIIIRGGVNIAPATIEALMVDMPQLAECAIVGYPCEDYGERVAIFTVAKEGQSITHEQVIEHLKSKKIASYKLPEKFYSIDTIPRNPVGKILRRALREQI